MLARGHLGRMSDHRQKGRDKRWGGGGGKQKKVIGVGLGGGEKRGKGGGWGKVGGNCV